MTFLLICWTETRKKKQEMYIKWSVWQLRVNTEPFSSNRQQPASLHMGGAKFSIFHEENLNIYLTFQSEPK